MNDSDEVMNREIMSSVMDNVHDVMKLNNPQSSTSDLYY
jgi:hypothetical protein